MEDDFLETTQEVTITTHHGMPRKKALAPGSALLILLAGGRPGERAVIEEEKFVIGRGSTADFILDSDAVSRAHAYIEKRADGHYLVDNQSTNGSFVNYRRVKQQLLRDGDQIQLGQSLFKYLSGDNIETAYHEEFRLLARRDALTGALNRATFDEELRVLSGTAQRSGQSLSLILFDLDHFKRINDTHGHTAGDLVLSFVGEKAQKLTCSPHLFARVGGEEFAVIFLGELNLARALAEELRTELGFLEVDYDRAKIRVTISAGVAGLPVDGSATDLYAAADKKLYEAKSAGRNQVKS